MEPGGGDDGVFRQLFVSTPRPMWVGDTETLGFLEVNDAAVAHYGYTRQQFLRLRLMDLLVAEDIPRLFTDPVREHPELAWSGEWRHRLAGGEVIDVELASHLVSFGGRAAVLVVVDNVTERKRAEAKLRKSEEQYRTVVDSIRQVIFRTNARGTWTFLNAAWTEITGFEVAETLGQSFLSYVHPEDRQGHAEVFQPLIESRTEYFGHEARYLTKAGGYRWIEVYAQLVTDDDGGIRGMFGTLTDITERKRADEELSAVRARLEHLLISSPAVIYSTEVAVDGPLTFVSENVTRLLGYEMEEVLRDPRFWADRVHPEDASRIEGLSGTLLQHGRVSLEYRFLHEDGTYRQIHDERRLVTDGTGVPVEIVGSWMDVTEHRQAEHERARLSSVVEQSAEAIVITAPDGTIEYVNPAFERLTGYGREELIGRTPRLLKSGKQDAGFYRHMWETLQSGTAWSGRFVDKRKDGTLVDVEAVVSPVRDASGRLLNYFGGMHDVTHQRQIEDQLRQAQKMEIAGRLAGGVAHDFNNLLTVITGRSQLLLARLGPDDAVRRDVDLIEETAQRAAALTRQLLIFSRKQVLSPRLLDLNAIVANMEKMLHRLIGEDVELVTVDGPGLGRVKADPGQVEQVIMNLAVNARDAMPRGGRLTIETANVDLDAAQARRYVGLRAAHYVTLTVTDTGCGMDHETLTHIFEPFFTTKGPDKGTGLGLSTAYGIIKQSDGEILVESDPGRGTSVKIYLPRVEESPVPAGAHPARRQLPHGSETILVAEDQQEVRDLAREILLLRGYTVLEARHGRDALEVGTAHPGPIHLLISDVVMPHMGGGELAEVLGRRRPEMRVLFMSGYTDDEMLHQEILARKAPLIEKPFTPDALALKVREVLDAPRAVLLDGANGAIVAAHGR